MTCRSKRPRTWKQWQADHNAIIMQLRLIMKDPSIKLLQDRPVEVRRGLKRFWKLWR
jgi:hypothetical protein